MLAFLGNSSLNSLNIPELLNWMSHYWITLLNFKKTGIFSYIKSAKTGISHAVVCMQVQKKHLMSWLRGGSIEPVEPPLATGMSLLVVILFPRSWHQWLFQLCLASSSLIQGGWSRWIFSKTISPVVCMICRKSLVIHHKWFFSLRAFPLILPAVSGWILVKYHGWLQFSWHHNEAAAPFEVARVAFHHIPPAGCSAAAGVMIIAPQQMRMDFDWIWSSSRFDDSDALS